MKNNIRLRTGDPVSWRTLAGTPMAGQWIADLSDGISLVNVGGKTVRVASSALVAIQKRPKQEEAQIMAGVRDVLKAFAVLFATLWLLTILWNNLG